MAYVVLLLIIYIAARVYDDDTDVHLQNGFLVFDLSIWRDKYIAYC